jgi:hypothetical protein
MFRTYVLCLCLISVAVTGCPGASSKYTTVPFEATVLYRGEPVEGATVTFVNTTKFEEPVVAVGMTDAQGIAVMRTHGAGDGVVSGTHLVTISKMESAPEDAAAGDIDGDDYDPVASERGSGSKNHLPGKYASASGGLTAEVGDTAGSKVFELVD